MTKDPKLLQAIEEHPQSMLGGIADHLTGRKKSTTRGAFVLRLVLSVLITYKLNHWGISPDYAAAVNDGILFYWIAVLAIIWIGSLAEQKRVKKIARQAGVNRWTAARYC